MENKHFVLICVSVMSLICLFISADIITQANAETTKVREENILINPQHYTVEPQRSYAVEIIRSYERSMDRFIDTVQNNLYSMEYDIKKLSEKIDAIEKKTNLIDMKITEIHKKLGISEQEQKVQEPQSNH